MVHARDLKGLAGPYLFRACGCTNSSGWALVVIFSVSGSYCCGLDVLDSTLIKVWDLGIYISMYIRIYTYIYVYLHMYICVCIYIYA